MKKLCVGVMLAWALGCDVPPPELQKQPETTSTPGDPEQLLVAAIAALPSSGDPELVNYRAQLVDDLARMRGAVNAPTAAPALESQQQALYQGNGCSVPYEMAGVVGIGGAATVNFALTTFTAECNWHDQCYSSGLGTYKLSFTQCNDAEYTKMQHRCAVKIPRWTRFWPVPGWEASAALYDTCMTIARVMNVAVQVGGKSHYEATACVGGQTWPATVDSGPHCSSYEPFDTDYTRTCDGVSGRWADNTVRDNWSGCRGSGCLACTDKLTAYPSYFRNHPLCSPHTTCAGQASTCGSACPSPSEADRRPLPLPVCKGSGTRDCHVTTPGQQGDCCAGLTCRKPSGSTILVCLPPA
jgi:hypothetical protein